MNEAPPRTGAPRRPGTSVPELIEQARTGQPRAVARLISLIEDASPLLREVTASLARAPQDRPGDTAAEVVGGAHIVGLTGAPGVGKSTTTSAMVTALRREGKRVGVLAIDPSSPFSGGALLGDRIRMAEHDTDPGVFMRSMASRGHLGGLAWSTPQALRVLEVAGCEVILVETVGVGQSEVEIASLADTTVVLLAPGMGDGIQTAKAGILEIGDVFVVNKADREGATQVVRDLRAMVRLSGAAEHAGNAAGRRAGSETDRWVQPVLPVSAQDGTGIAELVAVLGRHEEHLRRTGELRERRVRRAREEIEAIALASLRDRWGKVGSHSRLDALAEGVVSGTEDPYSAADVLLMGVSEPS